MSAVAEANQAAEAAIDAQHTELTVRLTIASLIAGAAVACASQALDADANLAWKVLLIVLCGASIVLASLVWASTNLNRVDPYALATIPPGVDAGEWLLRRRLRILRDNQAQLNDSYKVASVWMVAIVLDLAAILLSLVIIVAWGSPGTV
jgi:hypothetical protein